MQRLSAIPGERENSVVYHHNGFLFHKDTRPNLIYRCASRGPPMRCPGRVHVINEELDIDNNNIVDHIHPGDPLVVAKIEFKRELNRLSRTTYEPLERIYGRLSADARYQNVAVTVPYTSARASMFRHRALNVPATPQTLADMIHTLPQFEPIQHLYAGSCQGADGSIALIFINPEFIEPLRRCRMLCGDGTFKIRPRQPNDISQVYTLHFMKLLSGFPAIMAFTSRKTTDMYVSIFEFLLERIPELANVERFSVDFELAVIAAIRNVFPRALISGCFFHYVYAVIKYWNRRLHMPDTEQYQNYLEYALALAYLPPHEIENAARRLFQRMVDDGAQKALEFYTYYRRTWIPLVQLISVFGRRIKTNNICENFHSIAINIIGEAENIWYMLAKVVDLFAHYTLRFNQVMENGIIKYGWTEGQLERDRVVVAAEAAFGDLGVEDFLHVIVVQRRITRLFPRLMFEDDDDILAQVEEIIQARPLLVRENFEAEAEEAEREGHAANQRGRPPRRGQGGANQDGRGGRGRGRNGRGRGGRGGGGNPRGRGGRGGRGGGGNGAGRGGHGDGSANGDPDEDANGRGRGGGGRRGRARGADNAARGAGNGRRRRHANNVNQDVHEDVSDQEQEIPEIIQEDRGGLVRLVRDARRGNAIQFIFQRQGDVDDGEMNVEQGPNVNLELAHDQNREEESNELEQMNIEENGAAMIADVPDNSDSVQDSESLSAAEYPTEHTDSVAVVAETIPEEQAVIPTANPVAAVQNI